MPLRVGGNMLLKHFSAKRRTKSCGLPLLQLEKKAINTSKYINRSFFPPPYLFYLKGTPSPFKRRKVVFNFHGCNPSIKLKIKIPEVFLWIDSAARATFTR